MRNTMRNRADSTDHKVQRIEMAKVERLPAMLAKLISNKTLRKNDVALPFFLIDYAPR